MADPPTDRQPPKVTAGLQKVRRARSLNVRTSVSRLRGDLRASISNDNTPRSPSDDRPSSCPLATQSDGEDDSAPAARVGRIERTLVSILDLLEDLDVASPREKHLALLSKRYEAHVKSTSSCMNRCMSTEKKLVDLLLDVKTMKSQPCLDNVETKLDTIADLVYQNQVMLKCLSTTVDALSDCVMAIHMKTVRLADAFNQIEAATRMEEQREATRYNSNAGVPSDSPPPLRRNADKVVIVLPATTRAEAERSRPAV